MVSGYTLQSFFIAAGATQKKRIYAAILSAGLFGFAGYFYLIIKTLQKPSPQAQGYDGKCSFIFFLTTKKKMKLYRSDSEAKIAR